MTVAGNANIAKWLMTVIGIGTVAYHMLLVHWQIQDSTYHYITHLYLVMTIAALTAVLDGLNGWGSWRNKLKVALAFYAMGTAALTMGYYYVNAIELEMAQPFVSDTALWITGIAVSAVMVLCWIHWGGIITVFTLLAITYFFWGHLIPGPLGHPEYETNFIMS